MVAPRLERGKRFAGGRVLAHHLELRFALQATRQAFAKHGVVVHQHQLNVLAQTFTRRFNLYRLQFDRKAGTGAAGLVAEFAAVASHDEARDIESHPAAGGALLQRFEELVPARRSRDPESRNRITTFAGSSSTAIRNSRTSPALHGAVAVLRQVEERLQQSARFGKNAGQRGRHLPANAAVDIAPVPVR